MATLSECPVPFEVLGDGYAPDGGTFGTGEQSVSMSLKVAYDDEQEMIKFLLGYSRKGAVVAADGLFPLLRVPACQHPRVPRLWATKVSTKPYGPSWDPAQVQAPGTPFAGLVLGDAGPYPLYKFSQLTVNFGTVQFRTLTDAQLVPAPWNNRESYRYVQELSTTSVEIIQLKQGQFKFFSGAGVDAYPGAPGDLPTVKPTVRYPTRTLTWRWFDVPQNYLMNALGIPSRLDFVNAKVNSSLFHGYPPGTLLCLPPKYTPRDAPVDAVTLGLDVGDATVGDHSPARYYDVEFSFLFVDPPRPTNYTYRGHVLAMNQAPGAAKLFYLIVEDRAPPGNAGDEYRLYKSADFEDLFKAAI